MTALGAALFIDGWSGPLARGSRLSDIGREVVPPGWEIRVISGKLRKSSARKALAWLDGYRGRQIPVLCCGKSLGAQVLISQVLNVFGFSAEPRIDRIYVLTVDPCWPLAMRFFPDLSDQALVLDYPFKAAVNIRSVAPSRGRMKGSRVVSEYHPVTEILVSGESHMSIIRHPKVRDELGRMVAEMVA